jgi:hypothetical protein
LLLISSIISVVSLVGLTTCRSAANAKVASERNTAARSRGRKPVASRHAPTLERKSVAFVCCNGGFDSERDLPGLLPRTVDTSAKDPTLTLADDRRRPILIGHRSQITPDRESTCDLCVATDVSAAE